MRSARRAWARDLRCTSALLAAGALLGAGCASASSQSSSASTASPSGVVGRAVVTLCGGADAGAQNCAHRQVATTINVLRMPSHRRVASTRTNPAGWFRVTLSPGDYEVRAYGAGALLLAHAVNAHVVPHRFARVTLRLIPRHPLPVGAPS